MMAERVLSSAAARSCAATQISSGTRTARSGVFGWLGNFDVPLAVEYRTGVQARTPDLVNGVEHRARSTKVDAVPAHPSRDETDPTREAEHHGCHICVGCLCFGHVPIILGVYTPIKRPGAVFWLTQPPEAP